jgi:hypothetical protein
MTTRTGLAMSVGVLLIAPPRAALADILLFTNEADFIAHVGAHELETFETQTVGYLGQDVIVGNLTFSSIGSDIYINSGPHTHGANNTTPGGSKYLFGDSGQPSYHDDMIMGHVGGALTAWGAYFTDLEVGPVVFLVDGNVVVNEPPLPGSGNVQFFGFVATGADSFNTVTLDIPDITYGIDDVRTVLVPAPAAMPALLLGLLATRRRRRR